MTADPASRPPGCLQEDILSLFTPPVCAAVTDPAAEHDAPFPAEAQAVAKAGDKRRREFRAGRAAARAAIRQMGLPAPPVPAGTDRAPVWPAPLTGSISHSDSLCVAVVAEARTVPALGIDIEPAQPLDSDLIPEICTLSERAWLSSRAEGARGLLARLLFSAKECAYKCQYMLSRSALEFHDLEITADLETGQFEATFLRGVPQFGKGARLYGRYLITGGHLITATAAEPRAAATVQERRLSLW